ncbi:nucleotidyltransferase [Bacillus alkalicellulosilyticus]|uniref:nucleotidyltransferase n=1 Tax=Alkalihalobacterium alkalicellulosilyticum TaxID=1912214 RepID=UPI0009978386|nr:nucleotidyltransferase [Bacillus alkalicellulosilyticus]
MKAAGVIVEYNPFHNGHLYHLEETKKQTNADVIIAVMSGSFLQRGEPALVSKWQRTNMALAGGADLVVELPYAYSTQKAETFADGAVQILNGLFVDTICFGSESGEIQQFETLHRFIDTHRESYEAKIKEFIKEGHSYPKACSLAFYSLQPGHEVLDLSKPNNILGYYYMLAIKNHKSRIKAMTITRKSAQYHDVHIEKKPIASATSIRNALHENNELNDISHVLPETTLAFLVDYYERNKMFHQWNHYFPFLKHQLLTKSEKELANIYEGEEGLEYRLKKHITKATTFHEFMNEIKTKRYTWNRLQRYCLHILTNTSKEEMAEATSSRPYIRLLGMTDQGQSYLRAIKKDIPVPLLTKPTAPFSSALLELDKKAAACYSLGFPLSLQTVHLQEEYSTPPLLFRRNE